MREVPRPYFDEYSRGISPVTRAEDRRYFPNLETAAGQFFPSLGRSFDAFANLISPQFIFDRDGWTQEQRAVGGLISDTARFFLGTEYSELERLSQDPRDVQHAYPYLSGAAHGFVETTPLGSRGWTGFVEYLEQEPAELPLELALMGAGRAVTGARRLARAATPFDADVFHRMDLLTGARLPSAAESSVAIQTYRGARLLEEASGVRVGPQTIATASHVVAGQPGMPFSPTVMTARGLEGSQTGMIRGVQGILPEADIALLETADVSDAYLPLSDLVPGLPHEAIGDLGAGLESFSGVVGPRRYTDLATDAAIAETTLVGRGGLSGAGLIAESGDVSGIYLGELHQRGLFATGGTVSAFQEQIQGRTPIPVSQLHTGTIVDAIRQQGLHYRLARGDSTVSASPFLLGGLALHGRYGVQDPYSLVRLDPTRHREFEEGPVSGVYAYEGDIRDMLFEIKNPSLSWERRQGLLEYLRSETELWHVPDIFQGGGYDAITAVPSSVDRLRLRGFNQAEFYAEMFSDVMGIPFERDLVRRVRETTESSGLEGRISREANLSGAFLADPSVAGRNILTIDDIVATGTTMRETLSALQRAGATRTGGLGIASSLHNFMHPRAGLSRFSSQDVGSRTWGGVDFTSSQEAAISHLEGPGVISAVPGAGKTDVLVERVQRLMESGVSPSEVLTVAYNRAAIGELTSRFEAAGLTSAQARTVHSLAHEIVMDPANFTGVGFSHRPKIARDLTQERFRQMARSYPDAQVDFNQSESFRMAGAAETDEEWLSAYKAFKDERGLLTFGQMLDIGAEILETRPDVRQKYLEKYPFLQVDEFQDIADREWNFLSKLTPNVLGVGDINQAIYGFRGATGDVMADLYQSGAQYALPETFRSTPEIFQTAQRLIGLNEQQIPVQGRSLLGSGAPVDFRPTTGDTVFSELESILASRHTDESTAVLVRTNREIKRLLDTLGEEAFESVDIGTIHKGKGQGWDRVILPMETVPVRFGDSPEMIWTPRMRSQVDIENARRVGYVGLTRARQHAHVLGGGDLFEEMRTGERHLNLHGGFSYGFDRRIEGVPTLADLNEFVQRRRNLFFRATHGLEDTLEQESLDWAQTLAVNMRLREEGVDVPMRGEASALFPRSVYEAHQREIDYMVAPGSYVGESKWEPGMMGVFQQGVYGVKDLELLLKHAYWNPTPRLHMGGRELRLLQGEELKSGFEVSLPPDAQGFAPPGEFIIKPERMLGLFDYEDIVDLGTGDPFRGQPMELQYELGRYGLEGLRPIEEMEQQLRLHGRSGKQNPFKRFGQWMDDFSERMIVREERNEYLEKLILVSQEQQAVSRDTRGLEFGIGAGISLGGSAGLYGLYKGWQRFFGGQMSPLEPVADMEYVDDPTPYVSVSEPGMIGGYDLEIPRVSEQNLSKIQQWQRSGPHTVPIDGLPPVELQSNPPTPELAIDYTDKTFQSITGSEVRLPSGSASVLQTESDAVTEAFLRASLKTLRQEGLPVEDDFIQGDVPLDIGYLYRLTNIETQDRYVGLSHQHPLGRGGRIRKHLSGEGSKAIARVLSEYDPSDFAAEIYEIDDIGYRELGALERQFIKHTGSFGESGYNLSPGGEIPDSVRWEADPDFYRFPDVPINIASERFENAAVGIGLPGEMFQEGGYFTLDEEEVLRRFVSARVGPRETSSSVRGYLGRLDVPEIDPFIPVSDRIDVNTASDLLLAEVPGISKTLASRIVSYQAEFGALPTLQALENFRGVNERDRIELSRYLKPISVDLPDTQRAVPGAPPLIRDMMALSSQRLDINAATVADLEALRGIGPSMAERIVADREARGEFPSLQSLTRVKGIGPSLLSRMEPTLLQFGPESHPDVSLPVMDFDLPVPADPFIGHAQPFDIPIPGYERPYSYPSDMRDHIPLGGSPDAPLYDSLGIEDVPLESGFQYSLRKFQEAQGGATVFGDPSSFDEASYGRKRGYRQYDLQAGLQAELSYFPRRALRHFTRHGTEGFGEMLLDYPGEALQRQGIRVAKNYGMDFLKSKFTGQEMPGIENYLGDTLGTGLKEMLHNPVGAVGVGLSLAAATAYIGESSLDAGYADVIESGSEREQRFYDRFREQPVSRRTVEIGGKALQSGGLETGGLEKLIESIVLRVLAGGASDISDKLVTRIGRQLKIQTGDGRL